jgi:putative thiamine transport system ATP-binding protein
MRGALSLEGIRLVLHGVQLLTIQASIKPGEVLTVMGPSGSGKSSLLAFLAGFLRPPFRGEGRIVLDGVDISNLPAQERRIGLLFQDPLLFPHLSVAGNLMFGLRPETTDRKAKVAEALASANLSGFGDRDPETLSGGQKARIALLRLMLSEPRAVLLDEPFSKLDAYLRAEQRRIVFDRLRTERVPALLVTHDEADAAAAGGQVVQI